MTILILDMISNVIIVIIYFLSNFGKHNLIQVYIVLQDIESINKSETRSYRQRFLLTVDMMYRKIAKALLETKIQGKYLY